MESVAGKFDGKFVEGIDGEFVNASRIIELCVNQCGTTCSKEKKRVDVKHWRVRVLYSYGKSYFTATLDCGWSMKGNAYSAIRDLIMRLTTYEVDPKREATVIFSIQPPKD